ncbi:MAG: outer membrane protein assembly factor BamE [Rickettsiales bacterium]|nr:outer membrane protein assembly factor BamE [Rickettsiales bacterium]
MLSACEAMVSQRGHVDEKNMLEEVKVGETSKSQLVRAFGSPSSVSSFGEKSWYYIRSRKVSEAFFKPDITEQEVIEVRFDDQDVVSEIKTFDKADATQVVSVEKTTPTEGHSLGFFEQLLGNLGRFNKGRDATTAPRPGGF